MKNYLKLINFELGRFIKIYIVLAAITIISQLVGTFLIARNYMDNFNEEIYENGLSVEQFLEFTGMMSLQQIIYSAWFNLPIFLAAAALLFYCFFIWYRDWFGKNTFIYRLLMLPTARLNVLLSKSSAIFLMVFGLVALQIILLAVEGMMLKWMIPTNLRVDFSVMELMNNLVGFLNISLLIPSSFTQLLIHYGLGFMAVFVLFTCILFERSYYRLKGVLFGILYAAFALGIFFLPILAEFIFQKNYLYPMEYFIVQVLLWAIVTAMSIWISNYLLNKKVTV